MWISRSLVLVAMVVGAIVVASCEGETSQIVADLRARPASPLQEGLATRFQPSRTGLTPTFAAAGEKPSARVTFPKSAAGRIEIEDVASSTRVDITLRNAHQVYAREADGYVVYPRAHASGATAIHRALPNGTEDFVSFDTRPAAPEVAYEVTLGGNVSGLRFVANTLEMLDAGGAPRLRVAPPYIVGADGARIDATLAVEGCATDTSPAAPWGRAVTPPGARTCVVRVTWPGERVVYPAVLDPRWTTTGSTITPRQGHTASLLSTGDVLVVGGINGGTVLASAEIYNRASGTWAATANMTGARQLHTATQLGTTASATTTGKILIAGGISGTTSLNTAQLYSPTAGTWVAATNLNAARHGHTATLLANGQVLFAGGLNGTTVLNTAATYNGASGAGTWTAIGNMAVARRAHTATLLTVPGNAALNGRVLVVGGNSGGTTSVTSVQLFDGTSAWTTLTALSSAREGQTATALTNGNVLFTGGRNGTATLNTTLLFNAASGSGSFTSAGTMTAARQAHTATLLPSTIVANGQVLVVGGSNGTSSLGTAELWNGTSTWTATTAMAAPVQAHTASLLGNNMVLVTGGANGATTVGAARLYDASFALSCGSNSQCPSGFCVNGVCCESACNGGCGVCNVAGFVGTCRPVANGTTCRASAGVCDVAETCNGTALTCPNNGFAASTTTCRTSTGVCDVAENCTGSSASCPANGFAPSTTTCRASAGVCDVGENCTGSSAGCPAEVFLPPTTTCRASAGPCDAAETCTGTSAACPANNFLPSSTACRASAGGCDVAETCTGSSAACPADGLRPAGTTCRAAAGACDVAETCSGSAAACPADVLAASTVTCRASAGPCDVAETCSGSAAACPADVLATGQTICRNAVGPCDQTEICSGTSPTCPDDVLAPATAVCRPSVGTCDVAEKCTGSGANCPSDGFAPSTTACGANGSQSCTGTSPFCRESSTAGSALGFEATGEWSFSNAGTVIGLNGTHTQGARALEVAVQNYAPLTSIPLTSIGGVGPLALLDIMLPTQQANPNWFGAVQMFVNSPSLAINNVYLGQVELTGRPLATWLTIPFQVPADVVTKLADGGYSDLTFTIALNVPFDQTGHYLLDNLRFAADVTPILLGIANDSAGVTKAIFDYVTTAASTNIPYGPANSLADQNGFIASPRETPPQTFIAAPHAPFVGSLLGSQLTWTIGNHSVTATSQSTPLPTQTLGDGTRVVVLPDGRKVNLDSTPPKDPTPAAEPAVGAKFNGTIGGQLTVSATGAAVYTVPIVVPPGTAGMAPALSLVYNSQGGNGVAGVGWDLAGLSMIYRCPRTALLDGVARPVEMKPLQDADTDDGLCMDGQRLFRLSDGTYRTEIDHFSVIKRTNITNPQAPRDRFTVVTKSGETRYYGFRADSRVVLPIDQTGFGDNAIAIWALDRVVDTWGNFMDIHYNNDLVDFTTRGLLVTEIDYTGHLANSGADPGSATPPYFAVRFNYDTQDRPDVRRLRFGSGSLPRNRRLTEISTPLGIYTLTYIPPGDPLQASRLQKISYCAVGGSCMLPLEFDWDGGGYTWAQVPPATAPGGQPDSFELPVALLKVDGNNSRAAGVAFADLDGDGRPDLVQAVSDQSVEFNVGVTHAWRNNGRGWEPHDSWALPGPLANFNGTRAKGFLVDIDGDGLPDLVREGRLLCDEPDGDNNCSRDMIVAFNRLKTPQGGWEVEPETGPYRASFFQQGGRSLDFTSGQTMVDINGDGLTDFVNFGNDDTNLPALQVLMNTGSGWLATTKYGGTQGPMQDYHFADVNRDGLPDLVKPLTGSQGGSRVYLNTDRLNAAGNVWTLIETTCPIGGVEVDGDGMYDGATFTNQNWTQTFSTGSACTTRGAEPYTTALNDVRNHLPQTGFAPIIGRLDLNADGLADLFAIPVQGATGGGGPSVDTSVHTFLNTGTTWVHQTGILPAAPTGGGVNHAVHAMDLDGDGVTDMIESGAPGTPFADLHRAWLNRFRPSIIKKFPNGLAAKTDVLYKSIASGEAQTSNTYSDLNPRGQGTKYFVVPLRVVSSVLADDGLGTETTAITTYRYESMRASTRSHLPQGFMKVILTDPARITTVTTYLQAYPYTGMIKSVSRFASISTGPPNSPDRVLVPFATTETEYCDSIPEFIGGMPECAPNTTGGAYAPGTPLFVYPLRVTDTSRLLTDTSHDFSDNFIDKSITVTEYRYDTSGNPRRTTITTRSEFDALKSDAIPESFKKETISVYGTPGSTERRLGKVTSTTVTSQRLAPADPSNLPLSHTSTFEYQAVSAALGLDGAGISAVVLTKKREEADKAAPIRQDTTYAYDRFGNVRVTTVCGSDYDNCAPGAAGPSDLPFRTSRASYDPNDYPLPRGPGLVPSLGYGIGRFVVKRTNPLGHLEYSAYDPVKGALLQKTDPNGVSVCYQFDEFSRLTSETARCGSEAPITTTTEYFLTTPTDLANWKMVMVTRPATGATTWTYLDGRSRGVRNLTRAFDGGFNETRTFYDTSGRVSVVSNPHPPGATSTPTITTIYDDLSRPRQVFHTLGNLGTFGSSVTKRVDVTYGGFTTATTTTVTQPLAGLVTQRRDEEKNIQGKPRSVTDQNGVKMQFRYDADGSLTDSGLGNLPTVHSEYDLRGRKIKTVDPDQGTWTYEYNGFGDLVSQTDARGRETTMTYDGLARMLTKTDDTGTAEWVYDRSPGGIGQLAARISAPDERMVGEPCPIPFVTFNGARRAGRSIKYTPFGEIQEVLECIDGESFTTSYGYDQFGREVLVRYPAVRTSQLAVGYHYTSLGFLHYVTDESSDYSVLWKVKATNAMNQVIDEEMRNGVETVATRNPATGWLINTNSRAHADGNKLIQSWAYTYDEVGNLQTRDRADEVNGLPSTEIFGYDPLNRLTSSRLRIPAVGVDVSQSYLYDQLGNLTDKGPTGQGLHYTFNSGCQAGSRNAGPHAVCSLSDGRTFVYDGNGNLQGDGRRGASFSPANRPLVLFDTVDQRSIGLMYGSDGERVVQLVQAPNETARTIYIGMDPKGKSLYERTSRNGQIEHTNFIYAGTAHGGSAFAVRVFANDGTATASKYFNFDHLGSITAQSDEIGHVTGTGPDAGLLGYDAWGARRSLDGQPASPSSFTPAVGNREFAGQETIPGFGWVNMNGRIYDPLVGRFLSPDPAVSTPGDLQSYNRYSYVLNNPLRYTDPTGNFFLSAQDLTTIGIGLAGIAVCAGTSGVGCALAFAVGAAAFNASVAAASGAGFQQVVTIAAIGIIVGSVGGVAGGDIANLLGGNLAAKIVGGAIAGAATTALVSYALTGSVKKSDLLTSAAIGAIAAATAWAFSGPAPVNQANYAKTHPFGSYKASGDALVETVGSMEAALGLWDPADGPAPVAQALDPEGSMDAFIAYGESPLQYTGERSMKLTHTFKEVIRDMQVLGVDLDAIRVNPWGDAYGQSGFTVANNVQLNNNLSNRWQAYLLTHELVHSAQVEHMTLLGMATRYGAEKLYVGARNLVGGLFGAAPISDYGVPADFIAKYGAPGVYVIQSFSSVNPGSTSFFLDQYADGVRLAYFSNFAGGPPL